MKSRHFSLSVDHSIQSTTGSSRCTTRRSSVHVFYLTDANEWDRLPVRRILLSLTIDNFVFSGVVGMRLIKRMFSRNKLIWSDIYASVTNNWADSFFNTNNGSTRNEPSATIAPEQRSIVPLTLTEAFPMCCLLVFCDDPCDFSHFLCILARGIQYE